MLHAGKIREDTREHALLFPDMNIHQICRRDTAVSDGLARLRRI